MARVQLPLGNLEYALDHYLRENAEWLDPRTRLVLTALRESLSVVALSARALSDIPACSAPAAASAVEETRQTP